MKNYIWDFDGTLFNTYPHITHTFVLAMKDYGREVDYDEALAHFLVSFADCYSFYGVTDEIKARHKEYEHDYLLFPAEPFPDTIETVKALYDRGAKHYLYTHRGHESSQHYFNAYGLGTYFTDFVDSSMDFPKKPAPDALLWLMEKHNLDPAETIMTGDREIDVLSGINAGLKSCLFTREENPGTEAEYVIHSLKEILDI